MDLERKHRRMVIRYYEVAQRFYTVFWHRSSYGLHYGFWADGISDLQQAILKENEVLANLAGINRGDLVLDAGCGVGGSGVWLAREREVSI